MFNKKSLTFADVTMSRVKKKVQVMRSILLISVIVLSMSAFTRSIIQPARAGMPAGAKLVGNVGMRYQIQQKNTTLLCLSGCPMTGDHAWDKTHEGGTHGANWCWAATAAMVASYYLRKQGRWSEYLTPDTIAMNARGGLGPDSSADRFRAKYGRDLPIDYWTGHHRTGTAMQYWSLGYTDDSIYVYHSGRPSFSQLKTWIDGGHPIIVSYPGHYMAIDGYLENATGKYAHMLNPGSSRREPYWINWATEYGTINNAWTCPVAAPNVRSDWDWDWNGNGLPDNKEDYDGDGILDLDEIYVFHTDKRRVDTDRDGIADKEEIRSYIFDENGDYTLHLAPGNEPYDPNFPINYYYHDGTEWVVDWDVIDAVEERADPDGDGVRSELDNDLVGTHRMTATYYKAYIYDDHDTFFEGEWYFRLRGAATAWTEYAYKEVDGNGRWADFPDRTRSWYISRDTYFECQAREDDGPPGVYIWDYTSTVRVNVAFPGSSVNTWYSGSSRSGDVNHYYKYYIRNLAPTVGTISGPSNGYRGVAYTFSTSGADSEGDAITYQWSVDGVKQLVKGPSLTYTFGTGAALGEHTIRVRTIDYFGAYSSFATKTFTIHNRAPTVGSISGPSIGYRKVAYTWSVTGSDPDGDPITYYWYVDGASHGIGSTSFTYTFPTGATLGTHTIKVRTKDYFGLYSLYSTKTFTIYNRAPTVGSISGPSTGYPDIFYTWSVTGSDPDGDPITYQWSVNGVVQPSTAPTLTYKFPAAGTYTVRARTKDSHGLYSSYSSKTVTIITASIKIWADKTSYHIGETMKVYVRVKNPSPAMSVRAKIDLQLPDGSLYPLLNWVVTLPASYDSGNVLWQTFTIPNAPSGNYTWIAELRNPTTNVLISQSQWNWILWP